MTRHPPSPKESMQVIGSVRSGVTKPPASQTPPEALTTATALRLAIDSGRSMTVACSYDPATRAVAFYTLATDRDGRHRSAKRRARMLRGSPLRVLLCAQRPGGLVKAPLTGEIRRA